MSDLVVSGGVDKEAILRYLSLDPSKVETQALLLVADRYGLDPIMRHLVLVDRKPYITRDGLLHVAHMSGQLDGIVLEDQGETDTHYTAIVSVWRRDMSHPFRFLGRYPRKQNPKYGPEMAVKCAEVMGLRRAFDVAVATVEERWDAGVEDPEPAIDKQLLGDLHDRVRHLPEKLGVQARDFIRSTGATAYRVTEGQYMRIDAWLQKVEAGSGEEHTALDAGEDTSDTGLPGVSDPDQPELLDGA